MVSACPGIAARGLEGSRERGGGWPPVPGVAGRSSASQPIQGSAGSRLAGARIACRPVPAVAPARGRELEAAAAGGSISAGRKSA
eukprot:5881516-Heterocapsa_arctica.AAC.1